MSLVGSYTINYDDVSLDESQFFADFDGDGVRTCEPLLAGRFLCEAIGERLSSIVGATLAYDNLDSRFRPTRGSSVALTTEVAGLGGDVKYIKTRANARRYWNVFNNFIFSLSAEGGVINPWGGDEIRLNDRFFLGEPQFRGFDIRGVGPRVLRAPLIDDDADPTTPRVPVTNENQISDDAIGGNAYYLGRAELEIPLGTGARELGLRPSIFLDVGALFDVRQPQLQNFPDGVQARDAMNNLLFIEDVDDGMGGTTPTQTTNPIAVDGVTANTPFILPNSFIQETFLGDSRSPRVSVGIGVNWNSPFGPFRIDFAHVLRKQPGDDTKQFTFNVGTQF